jgi:hypothetical protein
LFNFSRCSNIEVIFKFVSLEILTQLKSSKTTTTRDAHGYRGSGEGDREIKRRTLPGKFSKCNKQHLHPKYYKKHPKCMSNTAKG